jgi:non-specific serine/threonine protein kinase
MLLRRYRLAAGLTQEDLAERAGLSVQGLSALESGKRQAPYRHTVTMLARALGLTASEAEALEAAVSRVRMPPTEAFGSVLREARLAAGLTQEALAERAGVSTRNIQALERGENRPQQETARRLAEALALNEQDRLRLLHTVLPVPRRRASADPVAVPEEQPVPSAPVAAPSDGMLTVLVADIRGYTAFTHRHGDAAAAALATRFAALAGEAAIAEGGRVVEAQGDEVLAVFTSARAALRAAADLQARCAAASNPTFPLQVGVGLDVGEPVAVEGGYHGEAINVAARLCAQAGAGDVLASEAVIHLARRVEGLAYRERGELALKGISRPVRTWRIQAEAEEGEAEEAPAPTAGTIPHNLPAASSSFIGREQERATVRALVAEARLVTLVGSGGVGKTRLALAVAGDLLDHFPDGAWLVELAALADPGLVPDAVAQVLRIREATDRSPTTILSDHLKEKRLLLVLDNCEHLIGACAALAGALLRACPHLRILATSREDLEVAGEHRYQVPSLSVPDLTHLPPPERLAESAAVALFVARARERRADFALTAQNARVVAELCARLDGIPLALELAAARVGSMPVQAIAGRLDDRFRLLTGGPRDALPRHRTLQATLDWSYDLLSSSEQLLLARLAVFAGGWTLDAAEAVGAGEGIQAWEVLDLLESLVTKSLAHLEDTGQGARYGLLETVRHYAWERLRAWPPQDQTERCATQDRHLAWSLALAEAGAAALTGPGQGEWLARLEAEHDNLRAALAYSLAQPAGARQGLALAGALWRFWYLRGHLGEGRRWLEQALALAPEVGDAARARARALHGAGVLAMLQDDNAQAVTLLETSLALYRDLGDRQGLASALNGLGNVAIEMGDYARAAARHSESLALRREIGDRHGVASSLGNLAYIARARGDLDTAAGLHEESLALRRELGDAQGVATAMHNLAGVAWERGDFTRAEALYGESLALRRHLNDRSGIEATLRDLAMMRVEAGRDTTESIALLRESLAISRALANRLGMARALEGLALAWQAEQPERAVRLLSAAAAIRREIATPPAPRQQRILDQNRAALRERLGDAPFDAAWEVGRLTLAEYIVDEALHGGAVTGTEA